MAGFLVILLLRGGDEAEAVVDAVMEPAAVDGAVDAVVESPFRLKTEEEAAPVDASVTAECGGLGKGACPESMVSVCARKRCLKSRSSLYLYLVRMTRGGIRFTPLSVVCAVDVDAMLLDDSCRIICGIASTDNRGASSLAEPTDEKDRTRCLPEVGSSDFRLSGFCVRRLKKGVLIFGGGEGGSGSLERKEADSDKGEPTIALSEYEGDWDRLGGLGMDSELAKEI
jgi:hypothetical protein